MGRLYSFSWTAAWQPTFHVMLFILCICCLHSMLHIFPITCFLAPSGRIVAYVPLGRSKGGDEGGHAFKTLELLIFLEI